MSLGVDLMPAKICNLDCIYCECGATTQKTNDRCEYISPSEIIAELKDFLSPSPSLDVVTITGSGEPALNTALGTVISYLKTAFPAYKTALLTNGTLLYLDDVRDAALQFDYVLPSLDAASDSVFASVNRPSRDLETGAIIRGIADFARVYKGILWLEIFIVPGINDSLSELTLLKEAAQAIKPARVQLNTLDRPAALDSVVPASDKRLAEIASFFGPLPVEIISRQFAVPSGQQATADLESGVLSLLRRRPSTVEDLAVASQHNINEILSLLSQLTKNKAVTSETVNNRLFYKSLQEKALP
jgi:wyosine [tRNA(Phe)-imidazoG37] synthetase (radical SAM superfamily)